MARRNASRIAANCSVSRIGSIITYTRGFGKPSMMQAATTDIIIAIGKKIAAAIPTRVLHVEKPQPAAFPRARTSKPVRGTSLRVPSRMEHRKLTSGPHHRVRTTRSYTNRKGPEREKRSCNRTLIRDVETTKRPASPHTCPGGRGAGRFRALCACRRSQAWILGYKWSPERSPAKWGRPAVEC